MMYRTLIGGGGVPLRVADTATQTDRSIVFLHGFSQSWLAWSNQLHSSLARDFRLVAIDLRGHGRSGKPRDAYADSKLWADDIQAVIDGLGLVSPILSGWSYGPLVILDYLRHYGEQRIGGLQFVGGVTNLGNEETLAALSPAFQELIPGLFSDDAEDSVRSLESLFRLCVMNEPSDESTCLALGCAVLTPAHVRRSLFSRVLDNDDLLRSIHKPVLITHGSEDTIISPDIVDRHTAHIAHAQKHVMNGAGHAPFWDQADAFNERLRAFASAAVS